MQQVRSQPKMTENHKIVQQRTKTNGQHRKRRRRTKMYEKQRKGHLAQTMGQLRNWRADSGCEAAVQSKFC